MTVAAAIEIGAGATPAPRLGKAPGEALVARQVGAAASDLLSSTVSAATSFRASWQSLLASLGSRMEVSGEAYTHQEAASAGPGSEQFSEKTFVSTVAASSELRPSLATEKESVEIGASAQLSPAGARSQTLMAEPVAVATKPPLLRTEEKRQAATPESDSLRSSRPTRTIDSPKANAVPTEPLPGLAPAVIASPFQAVPLAAIISPTANRTNEQALSARTEISANLSSEQPVALASMVSQPAERKAPRENAEAMNPAVLQVTENPVISAQPRQASPDPSMGGPTSSDAETAAANKEASQPIAMLAEIVNPLETSAPALSLTQITQTETHNLHPAVTQAPNQPLSLTTAPEQNRTQAPVSGMNPVQTRVTSTNLIQVAEPNQKPEETLSTSPVSFSPHATAHIETRSMAQEKNPIQIATLSQAPLPAQVASQRPAQPAAPNMSKSETLETITTSTPVIVPGQSRATTLIQIKGPVVESQNVKAARAPLSGDSLNPVPVITSAATAQSGLPPALPPVTGKTALASSGKAVTSETSRPAHETSNLFQQVSHPTIVPPSSPAVDASAMARASAGAAVAVSAFGRSADAVSVAASRPDSREAFATLDAAGAPQATTWIHAGTQRAEAGYQDPALGWVGIRADLSGGGVHAQLLPGSADAAQVLGSHLAGLNAYLAEHHTPVETLTLAAPESGWLGLGGGRGAGEGMQQGAGQQTAQNADTSSSSGLYPEYVVQSPATSLELPAFFGDNDGSIQVASMNSFHISVMA
jgi:hypothetical protein